MSHLPNAAHRAPFTLELLPVDAPLWGTFWQFDVLAPGSTLPALELALLRAVRLDTGWSVDTTPEQFLADLHATVSHPHAGEWMTTLAGQPLVVFAAPGNRPELCTVVWFCPATGCLHAGYHIPPAAAHFAEMSLQRPPSFPLDAPPFASPNWLRENPPVAGNHPSLATRLDAVILRWRLNPILFK